MSQGERLLAAQAALRYTSYIDLCEQYDALEQAARDEDIEDPQDLAEAQFFISNGFHLEEAFTVYMVECARKGVMPILPDISVRA